MRLPKKGQRLLSALAIITVAGIMAMTQSLPALTYPAVISIAAFAVFYAGIRKTS